MKQIRYVQPPPGYSYFPGDVVGENELGADIIRKHLDSGYAIPYADPEETENPESKLKKPERRKA